MADATVSFVVQDGTSPEAERPPSPSGTVVQYATENGIVYQSDNGYVLWYNDFPQFAYINFQNNPIAYEANLVVTNAINLRDNLGAPNNTTYYCDVDIFGYDDGSTSANPLAFQLRAIINEVVVSGYAYTCVMLKNKQFRLTTRIKFEANAGDEFLLSVSIPDSDFDAIYIQGGTCEIRRAHWYD